MVRASTNPAAGGQPLQETQHHELAGFRGEGAADACQDVDGDATQDDRPAAEAVAGRAIKDLACAKSDHEGRQSELDCRPPFRANRRRSPAAPAGTCRWTAA